VDFAINDEGTTDDARATAALPADTCSALNDAASTSGPTIVARFTNIVFGPTSEGHVGGAAIVVDGQTALLAFAISIDSTSSSGTDGMIHAKGPETVADADFFGSAIGVTGATIMTSAIPTNLTLPRDAFTMGMFFAIGVGFAVQVFFIADTGSHVDHWITRRRRRSMDIAIAFDNPAGFG